MNRPQSFKNFDRLYLGSIAVGVIGALLTFGELSDLMATEMAGQGMESASDGLLIGGLAFGVAVNLALWFLVSVLRIGLVKWVLAVFVAYAAIMFVISISAQSPISMVFAAASNAMAVASMWFLFRPESTAWLKARKGGDA